MKTLYFCIALALVAHAAIAQSPTKITFTSSKWEDKASVESKLKTFDRKINNSIEVQGCKKVKWELKNIDGKTIQDSSTTNGTFELKGLSDDVWSKQPFTLICTCQDVTPEIKSPDYEIFKSEDAGGNRTPVAGNCDKSFLPTPKRSPVGTSTTGSFVFDYATNQFIYPNKEERFSPRVDKQYGIAVINYNPYRDSLGITLNFEDRNMEYGEQFLGLINPTTSGGATATDTTKKNDKPSAQRADDAQACLKKLAQKLEQYHKDNLVKAAINPDDLAAEISEIESNIKGVFEISNIETELKSKGDAADYEKAIKYYRLIKSYRTIGFLPFQVKNVDVTKLTLTAYRNRQAVGNPSPIEFLNRGGFKIDFSLGILGTDLVNYKYITQTVSVPDTTFKIDRNRRQVIDTVTLVNKNKILRSNEGNIRFGVALLSHAYFRTGRRVNAGIATGFMLDNNVNAAYLLGGSLMLGSERRLVLSGGCAWGKVKRLEDGLSEGQIIPIVSGQSNNGIALKDETNRSWFLSVTYNLGGTTVGKPK